MRQHAKLPFKPLSELTFIGQSETGAVYEQAIQLTSVEGDVLRLRRLEVHLKTATRDGAMVLSIIANPAADIADALVMAALRAVYPNDNIDQKYLKTKRGPKKPRTPRTKFKGKPHVSTARLLAGTQR